ncbi:MAG: helix-turn-helix transcriptional regulator [Clostridia bacterium]|nr:helix-turn-helix transcriptional regulator [Clostridia bacterium]
MADLRRATKLAPNTITRMKKDQNVTLDVLERICETLDVDFGDIIEYKK